MLRMRSWRSGISLMKNSATNESSCVCLVGSLDAAIELELYVVEITFQA